MRNGQSSLGLVKSCHSVFPSKKQDSGSGASSALASKEQPWHLPEQRPRNSSSGRGSMGWWWGVRLGRSLAGHSAAGGFGKWVSWTKLLFTPPVCGSDSWAARSPGARGWGPYVIAGWTLYTTAGTLTSWGWTALCFQCTMSQVFIKKENTLE